MCHIYNYLTFCNLYKCFTWNTDCVQSHNRANIQWCKHTNGYRLIQMFHVEQS